MSIPLGYGRAPSVVLRDRWVHYNHGNLIHARLPNHPTSSSPQPSNFASVHSTNVFLAICSHSDGQNIRRPDHRFGQDSHRCDQIWNVKNRRLNIRGTKGRVHHGFFVHAKRTRPVWHGKQCTEKTFTQKCTTTLNILLVRIVFSVHSHRIWRQFYRTVRHLVERKWKFLAGIFFLLKVEIRKRNSKIYDIKNEKIAS